MIEALKSGEELAALLAWYREMGADTALGAEPVNWLARGDAAPGTGHPLAGGAATRGAPSREPAAPPVNAAPSAPSPSSSMAERPAPQRPPLARPPPGSSPQALAPAAAVEAARAAGSLAGLAHALANYEGCGLKATAKGLCLYRGKESARLMLIGEAPGREEDLAGKPFVGQAGRLLDRMLTSAGLGEEDVHITNIVYWRPPGNRTPSPQEAAACRPFLERQIALVDPEIILLLGGVAAKHMLATEEGILRLRGTWREIEAGGRRRRVLATLHPAYLLRTPASKRLAWRDLLAVRTALDAAR